MPSTGAGRRPRLLVLASTYPRWADDPEPGFVHELSRRLVDRFEVHVLAPHAAGARTRELLDGVCVHRYRYAPARWESLVNDGGIAANLRRDRWKLVLVPGFLFAQWLWLCALQLRYRFDVLHAHWLIPQGLFAAVLRRLGGPPYLVTAHGADVLALRGRLLAMLRRIAGAGAARVCAVSEALRAHLYEEGLSRPIEVLSMGVALHERFRLSPQPQVVRGRVLFVGRLVEKKGLACLLEALPTVLASDPGLELLVVGSGPLMEPLVQQVARLKLERHVRFLGARPQPDLPPLYQSAAVVVAPFVQAAGGDEDGLGLVVIEALGCGCPALIGAVPASAVFDGIDGLWRVDARDTPALARRLVEMLGDASLQDDEARERRRRAVLRWDWSEIASRHAELLCASMDPRLSAEPYP